MGRAPCVCQFLFLKKEFLVFLRAVFFGFWFCLLRFFGGRRVENSYSVHMTRE